MSLLRHDHKGDGTIVLFVIDDDTIQGSIASLSQKEPPKILYTTSTSISMKERPGSEQFMRGMLAAVMETAMRVQSDGLRAAKDLGVSSISHVHAVLMPFWYEPKVSTTIIEKTSPITVIQKVLTEQIDTEHKAMLARSALSQPTILESSILEILLNGYLTHKPYGKKALHIEAHLYASVVAKECLEKIKDIVHKAFSIERLTLHSWDMISYAALRDTFGSHERFCTILVGNHATHVSLVNESKNYTIAHFPVGRDVLLDALKNTAATQKQDMLSLLLAYNQGKLEPSFKEATNQAAAVAQKTWYDAFTKSSEILLQGTPLPRTIYLIDTWPQWIKQVFKEMPLQSISFRREAIVPIALDPQKLSAHFKVASGGVVADVPTILALIYAQKPLLA